MSTIMHAHYKNTDEHGKIQQSKVVLVAAFANWCGWLDSPRLSLKEVHRYGTAEDIVCAERGMTEEEKAQGRLTRISSGHLNPFSNIANPTIALRYGGEATDIHYTLARTKSRVIQFWTLLEKADNVIMARFAEVVMKILKAGQQVNKDFEAMCASIDALCVCRQTVWSGSGKSIARSKLW